MGSGTKRRWEDRNEAARGGLEPGSLMTAFDVIAGVVPEGVSPSRRVIPEGGASEARGDCPEPIPEPCLCDRRPEMCAVYQPSPP